MEGREIGMEGREVRRELGMKGLDVRGWRGVKIHVYTVERRGPGVKREFYI